MMRTLRFFTIALILLGLSASTLEAQGPGRGRGGQRMKAGHHRDWRARSPEERKEREAFRKDLVASYRAKAGQDERAKAVEMRFVRIARHVSRAIALEDMRTLAGLDEVNRMRGVIQAWSAIRRREDARTLRRLGPEATQAVEGLKGEQRHEKIRAIKAQKMMDRAIAQATKHGLVDEAEADALRSLEPKAVFAAVGKLHRRVIMHVHRDAFKDDKERARLDGLDDRQFFHDKAIRSLRFGPQLTREQINGLKSLSEVQRTEFLRALRAKGPFQSPEFLSGESAKVIAKMTSRSRRHFARGLEHMVFKRRHEFRPSRRFWDSFSEEQKKHFEGLKGADRLRYLAEIDPKTDWAAQGERWSQREKAREELGQLLKTQGRELMRIFFRSNADELSQALTKAGLDQETIERVLALQKEMKSHRGGRGGARGGKGSRRKQGRRRPPGKER